MPYDVIRSRPAAGGCFVDRHRAAESNEEHSWLSRLTTSAPIPCCQARCDCPAACCACPVCYRPQADTALLAEVLAATARTALSGPERILDAFAGTGVLATLAARRPGAKVTALDVSRRAAVTTWWNARRRGLPIRVRRGTVLRLSAGESFDLVLANPPYVPCARASAATGKRRAWDAGPDGRSVLDPLCAHAARLLAPNGTLLLVQSAVSGVDASLTRLRAGGLAARWWRDAPSLLVRSCVPGSISLRRPA